MLRKENLKYIPQEKTFHKFQPYPEKNPGHNKKATLTYFSLGFTKRGKRHDMAIMHGVVYQGTSVKLHICDGQI